MFIRIMSNNKVERGVANRRSSRCDGISVAIPSEREMRCRNTFIGKLSLRVLEGSNSGCRTRFDS